jgi:hypothetical protein
VVNHPPVVPAKAGTHFDFAWMREEQKSKWIPAFAGMTDVGGVSAQ